MTDDADTDTGPDVTALRAAIAKADALVAHYHQGITLAQSLKRTLVVRLLHVQFPNLTVSEQEKLLRGYGVGS